MPDASVSDAEFPCPDSRYRVPTDGSFDLASAPTERPGGIPDKDKYRRRLDALNGSLDDLQRALYAENRRAVLCVFQAMDAAGKDSTIRAVTRGLNPAGFQVFSFKAPSKEELDHDFLWRSARSLPERGRIGIFNRSYYEEVLVVRVHPEFLEAQRLPARESGFDECFWEERYASIRDHEHHLTRNGTVVLKFWLNVSRVEQHNRFRDRLRKPAKNWKFSEDDLNASDRWDQYMDAYQRCLRATSTPWAPWYAIPADDKPYMRYQVAKILLRTLEALDPQYPSLDDEHQTRLAEFEKRLLAESD